MQKMNLQPLRTLSNKFHFISEKWKDPENLQSKLQKQINVG